MNKVMRKNLKVYLGDIVIIHNCDDCKYGKRIHVLPFEDSLEGVYGDIFSMYLKPYFISIKGPELLTMWFGESETNVREV